MTLYKTQQRSLTDKQIHDSFEKFKSVAKLLKIARQPQLQRKADDGYISYSLIKKSGTYRISSPRISISIKQYCKNLENVKTVEISVFNCTQCGGTDYAEITSRKYASFDTILTDAFGIWLKAFNENLESDRKEIQRQKELKTVRRLYKYHSKKVKRGENHYGTDYLVGKRLGSVHTDDDSEHDFELHLSGLTYSDMNKLHKIIRPFLEEKKSI